VTGALEHIHDRVKHLVYLDAFVPNSGETAFGLALGLGRPSAEIGASWLVPPSDREFDNPSEGDWVKSRRSPHPRACFTEPVFLSKPLENFSEFSRTYIKATLDPVTDIGAKAFQDAADRAKASAAWSYKEIATTHMVASNQPEALAKFLLELTHSH